MNKTFGMIASFVVGFIAGGIVVKKVMDKAMEEAAHEVVDNIVDDYKKDIEDKKESNTELRPNEVQYAEQDSKATNEMLRRTRKERTIYSDLTRKYKEAEDDYKREVEENSEYDTGFDECNYEDVRQPVYDIYPTERTDEEPYFIEQEECGVLDDYDGDDWTYYPDGYMTDSQGIPISNEDVRNALGTHFPEWFKMYDTDEIWVRNERLKMDFSIVLDAENFEDCATPRQRILAGI